MKSAIQTSLGICLTCISALVILANLALFVRGITPESKWVPVIAVTDDTGYQKGDLLLVRRQESEAGTLKAWLAGPKTILVSKESQDLVPVGTVKHTIPHLGSLILFARTPLGILLFIGIPGTYLLASLLWERKDHP